MNDQRTAIIAVVTTKPDHTKSGGAPVFIADHEEDLQNISKSLEKILDASAHEINPYTMIIVTR